MKKLGLKTLLLFSCFIFSSREVKPVVLRLCCVTGTGKASKGNHGLMEEVELYAAGKGARGMLAGLGSSFTCPDYIVNKHEDVETINFYKQDPNKFGLSVESPVTTSRLFECDLTHTKPPHPQNTIRLVFSGGSFVILTLPEDWTFFQCKAASEKNNDSPFDVTQAQTKIRNLWQLPLHLAPEGSPLATLASSETSPLCLNGKSDLSNMALTLITIASGQIPAIFLKFPVEDVQFLTFLSLIGCPQAALSPRNPQARAEMSADGLLCLFRNNMMEAEVTTPGRRGLMGRHADTKVPFWQFCGFPSADAAMNFGKHHDRFRAQKGGGLKLIEMLKNPENFFAPPVAAQPGYAPGATGGPAGGQPSRTASGR